MSWFKQSPFRSPEHAAKCMVDFLAAEGELAGTPLTDEERQILAGADPMPDELAAKARVLVGRIFDKETGEDSDPCSFSNAMPWAVDPVWPNIGFITAEVATERNPRRRLQGWPWAKDKIQLVGYGLLAVILMMVVVFAAGLVFHWK